MYLLLFYLIEIKHVTGHNTEAVEVDKYAW